MIQLHQLVKSKGFQLLSSVHQKTENVGREVPTHITTTTTTSSCGMENKNTMNHSRNNNIQQQVLFDHHERKKGSIENEKQIHYLDYIHKRNRQQHFDSFHHEISTKTKDASMEHNEKQQQKIHDLDYIQRKRHHVDSFRRNIVGLSDDVYATIDLRIPNGSNNLLFLGNNYDRLFPMV